MFRLAHATPCGGPTTTGTTVLCNGCSNFYRRFFAQQFKRSCLPDGPKVGSRHALAPGRLADAQRRQSAALWLAELEQIPLKG